MWNAARAQQQRPARSPSVHSIASRQSMSRSASMNSNRGSVHSVNYDSDRSSDTAGEEDFIIQNAQFPQVPAMWQTQRQDRLTQKLGGALAQVTEIRPLQTPNRQRDQSEDTRSRGSTLAGDDMDYPEKTPTSKPKSLKQEMEADKEVEVESEPPREPGPLEQQLSALMSKLIYMERENPTIAVSPDDYQTLQEELKILRAEKADLQRRHEALHAIRDEDIANNIKIRGLLAHERYLHEGLKKLRDQDLENNITLRGLLAHERYLHDGLKKLRDDDLANVLILRAKIAEANRKIDTLSKSSGSSSPARGRPRPTSIPLERRDTTDLFAAAKSAALEQRALELEKRNDDLLNQIAALKSSPSTTGANIDQLNSMTAHKAWKDTVSNLEAQVKAKDSEIIRLRSSNGSTGGGIPGVDWIHMEALHEQHATHRETAARRLQQLRSDKEALQKELHRKEDENADLEAKVERLQRRLAAMT